MRRRRNSLSALKVALFVVPSVIFILASVVLINLYFQKDPPSQTNVSSSSFMSSYSLPASKHVFNNGHVPRNSPFESMSTSHPPVPDRGPLLSFFLKAGSHLVSLIMGMGSVDSTIGQPANEDFQNYDPWTGQDEDLQNYDHWTGRRDRRPFWQRHISWFIIGGIFVLFAILLVLNTLSYKNFTARTFTNDQKQEVLTRLRNIVWGFRQHPEYFPCLIALKTKARECLVVNEGARRLIDVPVLRHGFDCMKLIVANAYLFSNLPNQDDRIVLLYSLSKDVKEPFFTEEYKAYEEGMFWKIDLNHQRTMEVENPLFWEGLSALRDHLDKEIKSVPQLKHLRELIG